jgi:hypothetical protein
MASAFKLINFGAKITLLDSKGRRTKRNHSVAKVGELNIIL